MEEKEIKEQEIVEQEDKQAKKEEIKEEKKEEEIKEEKSDLMVIVEAITKGFETLGKKIDTGFEALGKKIDNLGTKIDTGFEILGKKIDAGFNNLGTKIDNVNDNIGKLTDVLKKYMSRENEWTSLKLYSDEVKKIIEKELNLTNYRFYYESKENGADFLIKVMEIIKEKNETKEETKAYIIVEVKDFPSENSIIKAYEQIEKAIKEDIPSKKGKKTITFKVPVIATILFRFCEEDPLELAEIIRNVLKEKVNVKFYDFHIGCFYGNRYYIISLFNYG